MRGGTHQFRLLTEHRSGCATREVGTEAVCLREGRKRTLQHRIQQVQRFSEIATVDLLNGESNSSLGRTICNHLQYGKQRMSVLMN